MSDVLKLSRPVRIFFVVEKGDINAWIHNTYTFNYPGCRIFNILLNIVCSGSLMNHMKAPLRTVSCGSNDFQTTFKTKYLTSVFDKLTVGKMYYFIVIFFVTCLLL